MLTPAVGEETRESEAHHRDLLPRSFLGYASYRYLKLTLAGLAFAIAAYALHDPIGPRSGGSVIGYALGTVAAALMGWLMWFGVRKRSYSVRSSTLKGWLSAHIYLGVSLVVLVPLHSGFQFDWNVHTFSYALVCLSVASGMLGVRFYVSVPRRTTENRSGLRIDSIIEQIGDLDTQAVGVARQLPNAYAQAVERAVKGTEVGGGLLKQLSGRDRECPTAHAQETIRARNDDLSVRSREDVIRLIELLAQKSALLVRLRRDVRYQALMKSWLLLHLPLSAATLVAVIVHVVVVLYYR